MELFKRSMAVANNVNTPSKHQVSRRKLRAFENTFSFCILFVYVQDSRFDASNSSEVKLNAIYECESRYLFLMLAKCR